MINLISDTITKPDEGMRAAMMSAEVGDDVFGEDPTVQNLENRIATMFGKEAAVYCPSGTMTNQIAIKVHTRPMDEMICDHYSHVYQYEAGGYAFHSGIAVNPLVGTYGKLHADQIRIAIKEEADWLPRTSLVVLENSTNKGGGNYYTISEIEPIRQLCTERGLALHLDGARIFNVLAETGESTLDTGRMFDSLSICLSKGLGAPVGSVLTGTKAFIKEARRVRKIMGGGMRQSGIIAAACLYALDHNIPQLKTDNHRAAQLGKLLTQRSWVASVMPVRTNIVIFSLAGSLMASTFLQALNEAGIQGSPFGAQSVRFVLHRDVSATDFDRAMEIISQFEINY